MTLILLTSKGSHWAASDPALPPLQQHGEFRPIASFICQASQVSVCSLGTILWYDNCRLKLCLSNRLFPEDSTLYTVLLETNIKQWMTVWLSFYFLSLKYSQGHLVSVTLLSFAALIPVIQLTWNDWILLASAGLMDSWRSPMQHWWSAASVMMMFHPGQIKQYIHGMQGYRYQAWKQYHHELWSKW